MGPQFYRVEHIGDGFLAVMAKPVAGDWVDEEFSGLADAGISVVVSLLTLHEAYEAGLEHEERYCAKAGIEFLSFPIPDRGLPASVSELAEFTRTLYAFVVGGQSVVVHCRAGIGRTGVIAAAVLLHAGFEAEEAFEKVSSARGVQVPDTDEQFSWIEVNQKSIVSET